MTFRIFTPTIETDELLLLLTENAEVFLGETMTKPQTTIVYDKSPKMYL